MIRNPKLCGLKPLLSGALRSLLPSPSSPPHHLLQDRPVSGTAKGKAKIKTGQPLKRSSIPKKKTSKSAVTAAGGRSESGDRVTRMVDSCLNAPTPLRHLTPKQREREAEREKLGLISKERQREIDAAKAAAKKGPEDKEAPLLMGTPGLDLITLGLVDAEAVPKYELTVEDGRRLAKEYSRVLMRRHRTRQAAESMLLQLKKEAIEALPDHLKTAALVPDLTPFPLNRFMATLTPPIEGYVEKVREAAKSYVGKEKLR